VEIPEKYIRLIRDCLSQVRVREFEIFVKATRGESLKIKNGRPDQTEHKDGLGFALRLCRDGRMGFGYGADFSPAGVAAVIAKTLANARHLTPDPGFNFATPATLPTPPALCDTALEGITAEEKWRQATRLERAARACEPRISAVPMATYEDEWEITRLVNSSGLDLRLTRSLCHLAVMVVADADGEEETVTEQAHSLRFAALNPQELGEEAARHVAMLLGSQAGEGYHGPVLVARGVVAEMLEVLAEGLLAANVARQRSALAGRLGLKVYSGRVTLLDDGLLPGGVGTAPFDEEGTPRQRLVLVEKGILQRFLCDRLWARRLRLTPTGNARRNSVFSQPHAAPNNLFLQPGVRSPRQILADGGDVIYITDVIGMHTADAVSGRFSVGAQGVRYRPGRPAQAIRSVTLSGNLHDLFAGVAEVASDLKFFGGLGAPSVLFAHGSISGQ
jgi:PmbA protein